MGGRVSTSVFVMTDVVGSTALWEDHVAGMGESLEQHDRFVAAAIAAAGDGDFFGPILGSEAAVDDTPNHR